MGKGCQNRTIAPSARARARAPPPSLVEQLREALVEQLHHPATSSFGAPLPSNPSSNHGCKMRWKDPAWPGAVLDCAARTRAQVLGVQLRVAMGMCCFTRPCDRPPQCNALLLHRTNTALHVLGCAHM
eukprot:11175716-Lingulodinium_polyedra.AAC.1